MRILINTAHQRFGGAVQVALSFIHEVRSFSNHEYVIWVGPGLRDSIDESDFPSNFVFHYFDFGSLSFLKSFKVNELLKKQEKKDSPDVIISTTGPTYFHSKAPQIIGFNLPLYIYPESPYVKSIRGFKRLKFELRKMIHLFFFRRDASYFVVQTEDVNKRVRSILRTEKVKTVTNTASSYYDNQLVNGSILGHKNDEIYRFVTISSYYAHKDLELIPKVIRELQYIGIENVEFILTLKDEDFQRFIGFNSKIRNVGPLRPSDCPKLYNDCYGMFLPTLAECFSASYPEAMKMKKPIVTTNLGFSTSICGKAAVYFEPNDAKSAALCIAKVILNKELKEELVRQGANQLNQFDSPAMRAKKYLELCEAVKNNN